MTNLSRTAATVFLCTLGLMVSRPAAALTAAEFVAICEQVGRPCAEIPVLQAYVGGALDLVAALDEQTDYLRPIYCKSPELLFDVTAIIEFIANHSAEHAERNAMTLVIRFLEEFGGCP